jgi:hypothetical protein
VHGFFKQNILEDGIKKQKNSCFFQGLENQRGFLQVGGKNKINNFSEKKPVLPISCNSPLLLVIVHVNKRLDSNPLSWWECATLPILLGTKRLRI